MRKVALLHNPLAGKRRERRLKEIEAVLAVLREAGVEASIEATEGATESAEQARQAFARGCDTIFACGGDGTIHNILQGLVGTQATLGIIPFGTGNVIAHDLRIPLSAIAAGRAALSAKPRRVAVGKVEFVDGSANPSSRFFLAVCGIGVDAHLFYELDAALKSAMGMASYYAKATHLWMTHPMGNFAVEFADEGGVRSCGDVSQLLAVRITNFGGALRELVPGASLHGNDFRLAVFRTRSRLAYLRYILGCLLNTARRVKGIEIVSSSRVECSLPDGSARIFVEADGELLGRLPARLSIVPEALTLLAPAANR
jgi:diacylglycerol kinase (ATP)